MNFFSLRPAGYMGQAVLKREKHNMTPESWTSGVREMLCRCVLLGNGSVIMFL
jgi:hypothetical protein